LPHNPLIDFDSELFASFEEKTTNFEDRTKGRILETVKGFLENIFLINKDNIDSFEDLEDKCMNFKEAYLKILDFELEGEDENGYLDTLKNCVRNTDII
jgi:hypothetical protein